MRCGHLRNVQEVPSGTVFFQKCLWGRQGSCVCLISYLESFFLDIRTLVRIQITVYYTCIFCLFMEELLENKLLTILPRFTAIR